MVIVQAKQFNLQTRNGNTHLEKIYDNKIFSAGVMFAIKYKEQAIEYCKYWNKEQPNCLCLLVEDTSSVQVWYEKKRERQSSKVKRSSTQQTKFKVTSKSNERLPIDKEFISRCQQILAESIGPISKLIVKKTLSQNTAKCSRQQFVAQLVLELKNKQQAQDIERKLKNILSD